MRSLSIFVVLAALAGAATNARASDAIRCGNKLVLQGDSRDAVAKKCGKPNDVTKSTVLRRPFFIRNGRVVYFGEDMIEVPVETWVYNFGPNKLMRRLRFVDGILEEIEVLGYGYNEAAYGADR